MEFNTLRRDGRTDAFFDGAATGTLLIGRCADCGHWHAPDVTGCHECGGERLDWAQARGTGILVTWATLHPRNGGEPAQLALVELEEGPWLYARLDAVTAPRENLALQAHFLPQPEGEPYLVFRPS
ncbi:MAG: zinc ribbon domain-containing protein [Streptosporangiaceae bacterium]